ncbi:MAG: hypothetical protein ACREEM_28135 [Blastocatellia bacterium]
MSAKITVIVYILICFEVGILLLVLPWTQFWDDNFFLFFLTGKLNASWLPGFLTSGYVRGAVTGLGALNILAGLWDTFKFRESVNRLAATESPFQEELPALSDHQPPSIPPQ